MTRAGAAGSVPRRTSSSRSSEAGGIAVLARVGSPDEGLPFEQDRLAAAEGRSLGFADGLEPGAANLVFPVPQALLEPDEPALDPEARPVERRLGVEAVVDEPRDELHVRLGLDEAAHHAERPEQRAVTEQHAGDDRVVWAPARIDLAGDREAGAAVLEDDAGAGRDDEGAEALVEALDQRDGVAVAVDRAQVDGAGRRLGDGARGLRRPAVEIVGADRAAFEQPEALQGDDALRRRRQLHHL